MAKQPNLHLVDWWVDTIDDDDDPAAKLEIRHETFTVKNIAEHYNSEYQDVDLVDIDFVKDVYDLPHNWYSLDWYVYRQTPCVIGDDCYFAKDEAKDIVYVIFDSNTTAYHARKLTTVAFIRWQATCSGDELESARKL